jgi:hypothetical protein
MRSYGDPPSGRAGSRFHGNDNINQVYDLIENSNLHSSDVTVTLHLPKSTQDMKTILLTLILVLSISIQAQETKVVVRAKAKDAKFIGSSIGGALIIIKDAITGELLATGHTTGSTGNTTLIMKEDHKRNVGITEASTAKFETTISIDEPTFVTIEALAPANAKNSLVTAQTQVWLIPGKDLIGEGIILEIPGFVIDVISPQRHSRISLASQKEVEIKANIVMMCGCPITKGGIWDSEDVEVQAIVKINGELKETVSLDITETASIFSTQLELSSPGTYEIILTAYNSKTGNTGVSKQNFIVGN